MRKSVFAAALAAALAYTGIAHADPSIWVMCDGQPRPEGAATSAARLGAVVLLPIVGLLAMGETGTGAPAASGERGVDACTQALAQPVLASFWQRHINILRARAIHYIEAENYDAALADLEAMHGVGEGQAASPLLDRSLGVSALLLEAALRARSGDFERARALAVQAADARPYSLPIQLYAARFFTGAPTLSADEHRLLERALTYDPTYAVVLPARLDQTDEPQAAADAWDAAIAAGDHMTARGLDVAMGWDASLGSDGYTLLRGALAAARANRLARASELADRAQNRLGSDPSPDSAPPAAAQSATPEAPQPEHAAAPPPSVDDKQSDLQSRVDSILASTAAPYWPLLRAWLASERGDNAGALALVEANFERLPKVMASADLLRRLSQDPVVSGQVPAFLVQSAIASARPNQAERFQELHMDDLVRALPQFERVDGPALYRPGRNVGYSENDTRNGTTQIVYSGATYYATGEMLLLRAAQLAQQRGFDSFLVLSVNRSIMIVAFVNAGAPPAQYAARASRFISAAEVISNLGQIYIDIPAAMEAGGSNRRH